MKINHNFYLRHKNYRDVCIWVGVLHRFNGIYKGSGVFWNMMYTCPMNMNIKTKVEIPEEELRDWLYSYGDMPYRDGKWITADHLIR